MSPLGNGPCTDKVRIPKGVRIWEAVPARGVRSRVLDRARIVNLKNVRGQFAPGPHIGYWHGGDGMMRWVIYEDCELLGDNGSTDRGEH